MIEGSQSSTPFEVQHNVQNAHLRTSVGDLININNEDYLCNI